MKESDEKLLEACHHFVTNIQELRGELQDLMVSDLLLANIGHVELNKRVDKVETAIAEQQCKLISFIYAHCKNNPTYLHPSGSPDHSLGGS